MIEIHKTGCSTCADNIYVKDLLWCNFRIFRFMQRVHHYLPSLLPFAQQSVRLYQRMYLVFHTSYPAGVHIHNYDLIS